MDKNLYFKSFYLLFLGVFLLGSCREEVQEITELKPVQPFALEEVTLLDGPFKHATELNEEILLAFDPDRLLARFRTEAGLEPRAPHYEGWEAESLAGHSLGHYLSALNMMFQTTGNPEFKKRSEYIVNELDSIQMADGDGYLGAFENGKKVFEEEIAKGNIRSQGFDLNGIWAPFYTHHKVLAGLRDAYRLNGNKRALEIAVKFADWIGSIIDPLTPDQMQNVLHCEHGGMNEVLVDLYEDTGETKYLEMVGKFYHKDVLDPLVAEQDSLSGLHGNTQIPKLIGLMKRYGVKQDENDLKAADFFWDRVVNHHSYVTGGNTNHEYFGQPDHLSKRLSRETTETCNVYNMLKLTDLLFQNEPSAKMMDYYERGLFNQILASQDPENGKVTYYLSLAMGGVKYFQDPFSFTCCVGSGMENHAKYNQHIYYHNEEELYLTQFIASELSWKEKGVQLRQQTNFPEEQGTQIRFNMEGPKTFTFYIRKPNWAQKDFDIRLNGESYNHEAGTGSAFIPIKRTWEDGDMVEIHLPFTLRKEVMPDDPHRLAVMYGPLVLAGTFGTLDNTEIKDEDIVPPLITEFTEPSQWLVEDEEPNTFHSTGIDSVPDIRLIPLYQVTDERFTVYWDVYKKSEWEKHLEEITREEEAYQKLVKETFDFFQPGEMQPERDHNFEGDKVYVVEMKDRKARQSERGGWFSFDMNLKKDVPMALVFEYWGGYTGSKTFDIQVDGTTIATQNISGIRDGAFLTKRYNIPDSLSQGKTRIHVKIQPHEGSRGGPVFGVRTVEQ